MRRIDLEGTPPFRESRDFDLRHEGRFYPPKLVISWACEAAFGRPLPSGAFSGGTETNRVLQGLGFVVTQKDGTPIVGQTMSRAMRTPEVSSAALGLVTLARRLLTEAPIYTWAELAADSGLLPANTGTYAWFFKKVPEGVSIEGCIERDGRTLLYVGISPGSLTSRETLRSRIRYHYRGNAEGSTFRRTLGCLLEADLGTVLRRVGSGKRLTFATRETILTTWLAENAAVAWLEVETPWHLETHLLSTTPLPLNIDDNAHHPFCAKLRLIRAQAVARARRLPILSKG
jgi:hypothetical protein